MSRAAWSSYYGVWTEDELACFASFRGPNGEEAPIIALMELYTQVRAKLLLAHAMAGCTVDQGCDNQNVCAWVNAGKPKLRAAGGMCKTLFWIGRYFQCPLRRLVYIPTKENCIADALSRFLKEASARDDWLRAVKEWGRLNPFARRVKHHKGSVILCTLTSTFAGPNFGD